MAKTTKHRQMRGAIMADYMLKYVGFGLKGFEHGKRYPAILLEVMPDRVKFSVKNLTVCVYKDDSSVFTLEES